MYYVTLFIVFSITGFIFENIIGIFSANGTNSGILNGPWTPLYGFAILLILIVNHILKKRNFKKTKEKVLFFLIITILFTIIEFIGGNLIEMYFHKTFWDYSKFFFNFGKYICLEISILWGTMGTITNYYIYPKIKKYLKKIPNILTIILSLLFLIDVVLKLFK